MLHHHTQGARVKLMQMGGATPNAASRPLPRPHRPSPAMRAHPTARLYASADRG